MSKKGEVFCWRWAVYYDITLDRGAEDIIGARGRSG